MGIAEMRKTRGHDDRGANERLLAVVGKGIPFQDALKKADEVLLHATQGISSLISVTGLVNVDFADVRTIMQNGGPALMGTGWDAARPGPWKPPSRRSRAPCSTTSRSPGHGRPHQHHRWRRPHARRSDADQRGDSRRGRRRSGDYLRGGERPGDAREVRVTVIATGFRRRRRRSPPRWTWRAGRAAVRETGLAADAGAAARIRAAGRRAAGAARVDAAERSVRDGDPDVHPAANGLMALRSRHLVAAGGLAAVALLWASRDAWPGGGPDRGADRCLLLL